MKPEEAAEVAKEQRTQRRLDAIDRVLYPESAGEQQLWQVEVRLVPLVSTYSGAAIRRLQPDRDAEVVILEGRAQLNFEAFYPGPRYHIIQWIKDDERVWFRARCKE